MRSDAQNLKAISDAIDRHNKSCPGKVLAILMNPFEVERLDWDDVRGIPIEPDEKVPTGRFRLVCDGTHDRLESSNEKQTPGTVKIEEPKAPIIIPETAPHEEPVLV